MRPKLRPKAILHTVRSVGTATGSNSPGTALALTDETFTQKAGQFVYIAGVKARLTAADEMCDNGQGGGGHGGNLELRVVIDGRDVSGPMMGWSWIPADFAPGKVVELENPLWQPALYRVTADTRRTVTLLVAEDCVNGAFTTVENVEIVLAAIG